MLNQTILLKVKERLNKLDSTDYDNFQTWQIVEAFNKGQVDWTRRNLHGLNVVKEGDEQSTSRIDDFQILLTSLNPILTNRPQFVETDIPTDYLRWKRISSSAGSECCPDPKPMIIYLAEQANIDSLLRDKNKQPSFEWGETFATMSDGKIQVWTGGSFILSNLELVYYRQPRRIEIAGIADPYTLLTPTVDVESEFKDDINEVLVDECVKILAGDIESVLQMQRQGQAIENNN